VAITLGEVTGFQEEVFDLEFKLGANFGNLYIDVVS
jgi:hypothetical protein